MATHLGAKLGYPNLRPSFTVYDCLISVIYDPCHMVKLYRNTFGEKKVMTDYQNRVIDWRYVVELNKLQEDEGIHFGNRLRKKHVKFFR